jgi:hypothetical protein
MKVFGQLFESAKASVVHSIFGILQAEVSGAKGDEKLQQVVSLVLTAIDGIAPGWAVPYINQALPQLINALVAYLNQSGVLKNAEAALEKLVVSAA